MSEKYFLSSPGLDRARCQGPGVLSVLPLQLCSCTSSHTTQSPAADIKAVLRYSVPSPSLSSQDNDNDIYLRLILLCLSLSADTPLDCADCKYDSAAQTLMLNMKM